MTRPVDCAVRGPSKATHWRVHAQTRTHSLCRSNQPLVGGWPDTRYYPLHAVKPRTALNYRLGGRRQQGSCASVAPTRREWRCKEHKLNGCRRHRCCRSAGQMAKRAPPRASRCNKPVPSHGRLAGPFRFFRTKGLRVCASLLSYDACAAQGVSSAQPNLIPKKFAHARRASTRLPTNAAWRAPILKSRNEMSDGWALSHSARIRRAAREAERHVLRQRLRRDRGPDRRTFGAASLTLGQARSVDVCAPSQGQNAKRHQGDLES